MGIKFWKKKNNKIYAYQLGIVGFGKWGPDYDSYCDRYKETIYISEEDYKYIQQFKIDNNLYDVNGIEYEFITKQALNAYGTITGGNKITDINNPEKIPLNLYKDMVANKDLYGETNR